MRDDHFMVFVNAFLCMMTFVMLYILLGCF